MTFNYAKQICEIIRFPERGQGIDYIEMRKVLGLIDKLTGLTDKVEVELEEEEWEMICHRLQNAEFTVVNHAIVDMIDYVLGIAPL